MNGTNASQSKGSTLKWYAVSMMAALLICPLKGAAQADPAASRSAEASAPPTPAQIVALDECDPVTFNAFPLLGPDFCHNVTLGAFTTLSDLLAKAAAKTPDPGWDFEPDALKIKKGTPIMVVDQGGEPHTFTEVKQFGGGFIIDLNAGEKTAPECSGGFKNVAVARTRILQGSQLQIGPLSPGEHNFQCCIHPWMRVRVEVDDEGKQQK